MKPKNDVKLKPRVRIAPSPTGPLHIGTARTALFNYLFAKKYGGKFVLRIEDTDIERSDTKWEKDIVESLLWLGITWDEGPIAVSEIQEQKLKAKDYTGAYGPYKQSERLNTYAKYLEQLLRENKVYYCFCSEEELEAMRQEQMSRGEAPKYNGRCGNLSKKETERRLAEKQKFVMRFRVTPKKIAFQDIIRGDIEFDTNLMGDIAIAKDLMAPLYNFAVVIDDFEMEITHVIRGEDHISNTPKQILIQEALGFPALRYAHLPLILGPDRSKLSKRHGATSVIEYRQQGYLPEALVNFMALLGWNPGTEKEIYTVAELVRDFSLEHVQKAGAVFNMTKLDYLNGLYIRQKSVEEITRICIPYWKKDELIQEAQNLESEKAKNKQDIVSAYKIVKTGEFEEFDHLKQIASIYKERLRRLSEITELTDYFFKDVVEYEKEMLRWKKATDAETKFSLDKLEELFYGISDTDFTRQTLEKIVMPEAEKTGDRGKLLWPLRVALTGKKASAGPFEVAEVLGKEKTLKRLQDAKALF